MDPEGAMDQEMLYLEMLGKAQRFEISEGILTIIIEAQQTLTFEQQ
jgi:heat shock protein HslJ